MSGLDPRLSKALTAHSVIRIGAVWIIPRARLKPYRLWLDLEHADKICLPLEQRLDTGYVNDTYAEITQAQEGYPLSSVEFGKI